MKNPYTIDASVFLNAFISTEAGHQISKEMLDMFRGEGIPMIVPTLLLPETASAISRVQKDNTLAVYFSNTLTKIPHLTLVPLDLLLAKQAIDVAASFRLRGSDAVYVTVALRYACPLITLDKEQHDRASSALRTFYPGEWLELWRDENNE